MNLSNINIGMSKKVITHYPKNMVMMGYANPGKNKVEGVHTATHIRALWLEEKDEILVMVNFEMGYITSLLRKEFLKKIAQHPELDLKESQIILSAQHTHSSYGGVESFSYYSLPYNGYYTEVIHKVCEQGLEAILEAKNNRSFGEVHYKVSELDPEIPIVRNRSLSAYNRNEDVQKCENDWLAIDRRMHLLEFVKETKPYGSWSWFPCHATCVVNTNTQISPDNKGYASLFLEEYMEQQNEKSSYVGVSAQGNAGDASPNYLFSRWQRGKFKDSHLHARHNGQIHFEQVLKLIQMPKSSNLNEIDSEVHYINMVNQIASTEFVDDFNLGTSSPAVGMSMLRGTKEGVGFPQPLYTFALVFCKLVWAWKRFSLLFESKEKKNYYRELKRLHAEKDIFVDSLKGEFMGTKIFKKVFWPNFVDKMLEYMDRYDKEDLYGSSWLPEKLPLQVSILSNLAIISIPAETTSVAGKRLEEVALKVLRKRGIQDVIISPYSNGYTGYITTPEEYSAQKYEGGHTIYGKWTLPVWQTHLQYVCEQMLRPKDERSLEREMPSDYICEDEGFIKRAHGEGLDYIQI